MYNRNYGKFDSVRIRSELLTPLPNRILTRDWLYETVSYNFNASIS